MDVAFGIEIEFELKARDFLLVYFFTTIGINASLKDLLTGGKPLVVLLVMRLFSERLRKDASGKRDIWTVNTT